MNKIIVLICLGALLLGACAPKETAAPAIPAPQTLSVTQTPSVTQPPAATQTPTSAASIDVSATQSAPTQVSGSAIIQNDECDNPYYPVVNGAHWQYAMSSGSKPVHSMTVGKDKTFSITVEANNDKFVINGSCTNDGVILLEVPGVSLSYSGKDGSSTLTTVNADGVTLPNDVQQGDDWTQSIKVIGNSGDVSLTSQIETTYKAVGFETVSTPIGLINALKVEQTGSVSMGGRKMMDIHGYIWYGQGIGVVKNTLDDILDANLISYQIPQP